MRRAAMISITLLIMVMFQNCAPAVMGLSTEGKILKSHEERIYVLFEEKLGKPGQYTGGWFYFPGLGIIDEHAYYVQVSLVQKDTVNAFPQQP